MVLDIKKLREEEVITFQIVMRFSIVTNQISFSHIEAFQVKGVKCILIKIRKILISIKVYPEKINFFVFLDKKVN